MLFIHRSAWTRANDRYAVPAVSPLQKEECEDMVPNSGRRWTNHNERLDLRDLGRLFEVEPGRRERVGFEVEYGIVDPKSGRSVSYDGASGSRALLKSLAEQ